MGTRGTLSGRVCSPLSHHRTDVEGIIESTNPATRIHLAILHNFPSDYWLKIILTDCGAGNLSSGRYLFNEVSPASSKLQGVNSSIDLCVYPRRIDCQETGNTQ